MQPDSEPGEAGELRIAARVEDIPEIERIATGIINVLKKLGRYEPEVDNIWVWQIANCTFRLKRIDSFLDAPTATEYTYAHVIDMQSKQQAMIEHAMDQLALSRKERMETQAEADLKRKLREEIEKATKP